MRDMDDQVRGEEDWARAKELIASRQTSEATAHLEEAERSFTASGDEGRLMEVLLTESQNHLCRGLTPRALDDVDKATRLVDRQGRPIENRRFLFQRGLVYLCIGREEEAHRDISRYLELSEGLEDHMATVRGHFYLALIYERHGEPCMAAAELEVGRDAAERLGSTILSAGLTAFLAHLWLRRGEMEMARTLESEASRLMRDVTDEEGTSSRGMALLANAEVRTMNMDLSGGQEAFRLSLAAFHHSRLSHYFEAFAHASYGETLLRQGLAEEGCSTLNRARSLYEELSNRSQVERITALISGAGDPCRR